MGFQDGVQGKGEQPESSEGRGVGASTAKRGVCNGQKIACGRLDIEAQQQEKVLPVLEIMWLSTQDMWTC